VLIICPVDTGDFRNLSGRNVLKPAQIANGVAGLPYGAYMRIFGTRFFRLAIVGSITNVLLFTSASPASAVCVINQAEIRQISDRSVMVVLDDSACTREFGEFGYYTEIAPDVFGEVMGGYGSRPIDSSGVGFRPGGYGYVIETPTPEPTYSAGVWVADADGVVVVPTAAAEKVIELLKQYDDKESKMIPIIEREKSMRKALEQFNRY
jgi:hypothetical protein